jgi:recombination protein RecA
VTKSGSFFSLGDERLGQGRNNAKAYLREHPDVADAIEARIYEAAGVERPAASAEPAHGAPPAGEAVAAANGAAAEPADVRQAA